MISKTWKCRVKNRVKMNDFSPVFLVIVGSLVCFQGEQEWNWAVYILKVLVIWGRSGTMTLFVDSVILRRGLGSPSSSWSKLGNFHYWPSWPPLLTPWAACFRNTEVGAECFSDQPWVGQQVNRGPFLCHRGHGPRQRQGPALLYKLSDVTEPSASMETKLWLIFWW